MDWQTLDNLQTPESCQPSLQTDSQWGDSLPPTAPTVLSKLDLLALFHEASWAAAHLFILCTECESLGANLEGLPKL